MPNEPIVEPLPLTERYEDGGSYEELMLESVERIVNALDVIVATVILLAGDARPPAAPRPESRS